MKLVYQYMAIFFTFSPTSSHLHPLQVENCGSDSRLVVDEDDNGKFRLQRVNLHNVGGHRLQITSKVSIRSSSYSVEQSLLMACLL